MLMKFQNILYIKFPDLHLTNCNLMSEIDRFIIQLFYTFENHKKNWLTPGQTLLTPRFSLELL